MLLQKPFAPAEAAGELTRIAVLESVLETPQSWPLPLAAVFDFDSGCGTAVGPTEQHKDLLLPVAALKVGVPFLQKRFHLGTEVVALLPLEYKTAYPHVPHLVEPAVNLLLSDQIFALSEGVASPEKSGVCRVAAAGAWKGQPERQQLAWVAAATNGVGVGKAGAENRLTPLADVDGLLGLPNRSLQISLKEVP